MALTANELRIGNWVEYNINFPPTEFIQLKKIDIDDDFIDCTPIPLSPEILIRCGFSTDYKIGLYRGRFLEWNCGDGFWITDDKDELYEVDNITSLHQLQNLYYSLTGEELIFKP